MRWLGAGSWELGARKALFLFLLFAPGSYLLAPSIAFSAPVDATAKVMKEKIKIGDELRFHVQVTHPRKFTVEPLGKPPLGVFEIKKADPPVRRGQNRVSETFSFTLTCFELGDHTIPPVKVSYRNESGELEEITTQPVGVKVVSVGKRIIDKDDIRPIKGPAPAQLARFRNGILWTLAGILALVLAVLWTRRWLKALKEAESRKPPHERLAIELARLKEQGLLEDRNYKEYYGGLSDILRRYIERTLKVEAFERTTSELVEEMRKKDLSPAVVNDVRGVLEETDLVKFAKLEPERTLAARLEDSIGRIVEATRPRPKENK